MQHATSQGDHARSFLWCGFAVGLAVLLLVTGGAAVASAAMAALIPPICVNTAGSGGCYTSIQAAVVAAASGAKITIAAGTYSEAVDTGAKTLWFDGAGVHLTFVDGGGTTRVFSTTADIQLSNLTVQNGYAAGTNKGGGIVAAGAVTLTNAAVLSNTTAGGLGGGVYADDLLVVDNTQFVSNTAGSNGGGAYAVSGAVVTGGLFQNNTAIKGGALFVVGGGAALTGTTFLSNTATGSGVVDGGGGIATGNSWRPLVLADVTMTYNRGFKGGAIYGATAVSMTGGIYAYNVGTGVGGVLNSLTVITVTGVQLIGNSALEGGAVYQSAGGGSIVNSLFAGNTAITGSAVYRRGSTDTTVLLNSTIGAPAQVTGTAIYVYRGTAWITNTLVAAHATGIQRAGGTVSEDYNLFTGVTTQTVGTVDGGTHSFSSTDARFVDPANGDYHLRYGSPASGRGTNAGVLVDLDGTTRADPPAIGAYEASLVPANLALEKTASFTTGVPFLGTVVYTLTLARTNAQDDPNIVMTDVLPAGTTFKSWILQPNGTEWSSTAITWTGAMTDAGEIALVYAVTNTASGGATIINTAGFSGTRSIGSTAAAYTTTLDCYPTSSGNWSVVFSACTDGAKRIIPAGTAVTLDVDVTLTGDFEVQPGGTFTANSKTVTLSGSSVQTLTGSPLNFYKLVLIKDGKYDSVRMAGKLNVTKKLTITKGSLISASEYGDLEIEELGVLTLTDPISITGSFTNSGDLYTEGHALNFTGGLVAPVQQDLVLNVWTSFDDVNVMTGTTLVEAVTDDNAYVGGALTNYGIIRKTQPIAAATQYYFGLAGRYAGNDMEVDAAAVGTLSSLQVDRIDANPADLTPEHAPPLYWQIAPLGSGYNVTLTLPYDGVADPLACRRTAGSAWDCARSLFETGLVTRTNVTAFSDWAVFDQHATTTTVAAGPNPSVFGQGVVFTATVDPAAVGGSVQFFAGGAPLGSPQPLASGNAVLMTGTLPVGSYTISATAVITSAAYLGSEGQLAGFQVVNKANTTTALASSVNPAELGQPVAFTATVSVPAPGVGLPTGVVTFTISGDGAHTAAVGAGGVATYTTAALLGGTHTITAAYGGDGSYAGSTSQPYEQVVQVVQPLAVNDGAGTLQDTPVTVMVLANDLDPVGDGLTVSAITLIPVNGTALPTGDGKAVLYTPNAGFSGQDSFMYVAQDANGSSDDALVTVVVAPKSQTGEPPQVAVVDPQVENDEPFTSTNAAVAVQLPANFITQTLEDKDILFLSYTPAMTPTEETTTPPGNLKFGNFEFDLTLFLDNEPQHGVQFAVPITVTITYDPAVVAGLKEETLEVYYWEGTAWITSGITVVDRDLANHSITILLAHLSRFGFFAQRTPTDLDPVDEPGIGARLYLPGVLREVTAAGPVEQAVEQPTDQSPEQTADLDAVKQMYLPLLNK